MTGAKRPPPFLLRPAPVNDSAAIVCHACVCSFPSLRPLPSSYLSTHAQARDTILGNTTLRGAASAKGDASALRGRARPHWHSPGRIAGVVIACSAARQQEMDEARRGEAGDGTAGMGGFYFNRLGLTSHDAWTRPEQRSAVSASKCIASMACKRRWPMANGRCPLSAVRCRAAAAVADLRPWQAQMQMQMPVRVSRQARCSPASLHRICHVARL